MQALLCQVLKAPVLSDIYQMLKKGEYHYTRGLANHEGKMAARRRFLGRRKKSGDLKQSA